MSGKRHARAQLDGSMEKKYFSAAGQGGGAAIHGGRDGTLGASGIDYTFKIGDGGAGASAPTIVDTTKNGAGAGGREVRRPRKVTHPRMAPGGQALWRPR